MAQSPNSTHESRGVCAWEKNKMGRKNQPYLPLYVQDVLTDEKLIECSAQSHGVYFRLLCILHKQETYGAICLKDKYRSIDDNVFISFANMLSRQMPFSQDVIMSSLKELNEEGVIDISEDVLSQKRMIRDAEISDVRSKAGSAGGKACRNIPTKKLYSSPGFVYLAGDRENSSSFKIGISKLPKKRVSELSSRVGGRDIYIIKTWDVDNMGEKEQAILDYFGDKMNGEWIVGVYNSVDIQNIIDDILK